MDNAVKLTHWKAHAHHTKGLWPPLYKVRPRGIEQICLQANYEEELAERLFIGGNTIIVTDNQYSYPYNAFDNLPDNLITQHIIWIRQDHKVSFNEVIQYVNQEWPGMDFILFENEIESRSIKTIDHYHLLLRKPIPNLKLVSLQVFIGGEEDTKSHYLVNHLLHTYRPHLKGYSYGVIRSEDIDDTHLTVLPEHQMSIYYLSREAVVSYVHQRIAMRYGQDVADAHCSCEEAQMSYTSHYKVEVWNNGETRQYYNGLQF